MSDFVLQQGQVCEFSSSDSWVILSEIEQSIKRKIESVGTPLKDWDINIYRGVLTGYNDAFIISTEKRDEILSNCETEEERQRTEELIRPILRGRDIKRYGYDWAGLWLINTHNGVKGKFPRIDINDYPAVKAHLDQYWDKIEKRADQGDTPYNLRNCAYVDDFNKPKIIYNDIAQSLTFAMSTNGEYLNNTAYFFIGKEPELKLLLKALNSKVLDWYYRTLSVQLGEKAVRMFSIYVLKIPIPKERIIKLLNVDDELIDSTMCSIYGLTDIERQAIGVQ
jgi:type II restriction/modification system DNA methylase subunit YeeA